MVNAAEGAPGWGLCVGRKVRPEEVRRRRPRVVVCVAGKARMEEEARMLCVEAALWKEVVVVEETSEP